MPLANGVRRLPSLTLALVLCAVPALISQQTAKPLAPRSSARTGAISGVVSDAATARPLAGVVVSLTAPGGPTSLRTITDSKGRFVFRYLPASDSYVLRAAKPGYIAGGLARTVQLTPVRISLADDEWISDANIVMWLPGGISGRVVDERGEPVVNVPVRVLAQIPVAGASRWAIGPGARTDDRGVYRIAGLTRGTYVVSVPLPQSVVPVGTPPATVLGQPQTKALYGVLPRIAGLDVNGWWLLVGFSGPPPPPAGGEAYPSTYYPSAREFSAATPIELSDSEEKHNIDFVLRPVATVRVSGRVIGPTDILAGLVVRLFQESAEPLGAGNDVATSLVDGHGAFSFVGVPSGRYVLEARTGFAAITVGAGPLSGIPGLVAQQLSEGLPTLFGEYFSATYRVYNTSSANGFEARLPITVGSADVANVTVPLERGGTISGRIVREDGGPVPKTLYTRVDPATGDPSLRGQFSDPPPSATLDRQQERSPAGVFAVQGLHRGPYFLRVSASDGWFVKSIAADGDYTDRPFDAAPGADITGVVVTLTNRVAKLSGTVRNRDGSPARDAGVILFPADRTQWTAFGLTPRRIRSVEVFESQSYEIPRLSAGDYLAIAVDGTQREEWLDPRFFPAAAPLATRITLTWGSDSVQDLTLQRVILR